MKFHFGTSSWGGTRKLPCAFTEQGVAMLSSVLRSERAAQVNILIMRTFIKLRKEITKQKELAKKLKELEFRIEIHDKNISEIIEAINQLIEPPQLPKRKMGFEIKEKKVIYKSK